MASAGLNEEEFHWHTLGFLLVLHGDLVEAAAELEGALAAATAGRRQIARTREPGIPGMGRLRQHDLPAVKEMTLLADELVRARAFPSAGMVKALQSWVAWKEGRHTEAERLALEALEQWRPTVVRYPFCWICLWPLIAVRTADGRSRPSGRSCPRTRAASPDAAPVRTRSGCAICHFSLGERRPARHGKLFAASFGGGRKTGFPIRT